MGPPRERFERSISEEEERTKELFDNFKTEMMEKFQKQEERILRQEEKNTEQDLKISRQSDTISKRNRRRPSKIRTRRSKQSPHTRLSETFYMHCGLPPPRPRTTFF